MASVKQRGEDRWLLVWGLKTSAGDWKQCSRMFTGSRQDAEREAAAQEREARRIMRPDNFRTATLGQWAAHWLGEQRRAVAPKPSNAKPSWWRRS
jgi:hypothetical protein